MAIYSEFVPSKTVIFHSYVQLPEGIQYLIHMLMIHPLKHGKLHGPLTQWLPINQRPEIWRMVRSTDTVAYLRYQYSCIILLLYWIPLAPIYFHWTSPRHQMFFLYSCWRLCSLTRLVPRTQYLAYKSNWRYPPLSISHVDLNTHWTMVIHEHPSHEGNTSKMAS